MKKIPENTEFARFTVVQLSLTLPVTVEYARASSILSTKDRSVFDPGPLSRFAKLNIHAWTVDCGASQESEFAVNPSCNVVVYVPDLYSSHERLNGGHPLPSTV